MKALCNEALYSHELNSASRGVQTRLPLATVWALPCENVSSGICRQRWSRSACTSALSDQGLSCPLQESLDTTECMDWEQRPGWYFAHVQNDMFTHFAHVQRHFFTWDGPYHLNKFTDRQMMDKCSLQLIPSGRLMCANKYSLTSMAWISLGPWKLLLDMGSSNHWWLILVPGQEANGDNLGKYFQSSIKQCNVECTNEYMQHVFSW